MSLLANTQIEPVAYAGWPHCYRITNGEVELIVTTDVGPRIIRYGFIGGQNLFAEFADQLGKSGESWWAMRGGHRLWIAPEVVPDTYALDNAPVLVTIGEDAITLLQPVEPETGLQKELSIAFTENGHVAVTHRLQNASRRARRVSIWAITQMVKGGVAIAPFPPRGCHQERLQPTHPMIMWAYTDFTDKRWTLTKNYLILKQDADDHSPQKAGMFNENTRAAYLSGTDLFVKRYRADCDLAYPDFQASFEVFTNGGCLELETLSPLVDLQPGQSSTHLETWSLHRDVQLIELTESEIDRAILPFLS
jgi:hypothetical protein